MKGKCSYFGVKIEINLKLVLKVIQNKEKFDEQY